MKLNRRRLLLFMLAGASGLAACGRQTSASITPAEIDAASTCDLDGMLLGDYPGPKAQIYYAGDPKPHWCCDTVEMFSTLLKPEQVKAIQAVFVQDMGRADWEQPRGHWFDAKTGFYVLGSKRHGSMGPTVASFRQEADARTFIVEHGGRLLRYAEVKPEMVDLSGGVLHDGRM
ncbi:nitrous oxide reductase accessory protein NosL [Cupriavidus basilensis]|uniref:Nitrous oxide reductase accessory protein NosL n=1 Tax=Cupriavidus basilensis TaxID=68895 RepID=A0ABT6AGQ5_9BURK|nr:nitrous oxide reductase accessory protein NosL [Cupriavidus basilensis]MDF3831784.1 nitrous oxide reductase accessory protein NosL [Cupriavidus basilensis]